MMFKANNKKNKIQWHSDWEIKEQVMGNSEF